MHVLTSEKLRAYSTYILYLQTSIGILPYYEAARL